MMRCPLPLSILLLAPVLATGCRTGKIVIPPEPRNVYVTVKAHLDKEGKPVYDEKYHHAELVRPGDKVSFACECKGGLEFTVTEPKLAIDLKALESLIDKRDGDTQQERLENLRGELERARAYLQKPAVPAADGDNAYLEEQAAPAANGENAYLAKQALPGGDGDNGGFLPAFLEGFIKVISPPAPEVGLFGEQWPELEEFHPGNRSIGPFTVGPIDRESEWKFTWKVRVQGQPGTEVSWDPHLMGNPDL